MFGKGDNADVIEANTAVEEDKVCEDVYELEDGEWVIINVHGELKCCCIEKWVISPSHKADVLSIISQFNTIIN